MKVPSVVELPTLQHLPDVLKKADLQKLQEEFLTCLPSLPHMPDLQKFRDELKTSLLSMDLLSSPSTWHIVELLTNCLPERFLHSNHTDACVLVLIIPWLLITARNPLCKSEHDFVFFEFSPVSSL